ncbi:MAG TPA: tetratricopeptide repeat protein [Kineosporiaceae bacterium]|nr:tetratricopeptide repeat protein [Kineosporiaceae bacterium]
MAYRQARFPGARRVLAQDAVPRYDLSRTLMAQMMAQNPALSILLLFGDVEMEQLDLDPRTGADIASSFSRSEPDTHGLIIAGDLLVNSAIHHVSAPIGLSLYVLGGLRARNIAISGLELVVRGSVAVEEVICGSGPQGGARLDGGVSAKLLISDGFPMLIGGRLAAPVLDTGRTRIGVVEGDGVREATGEVPPAVVLADSVRDPKNGRFSFTRWQSTLAAAGSGLSADYLSGRTNLESLRELRSLEREIDEALREGRYARGAELLRKARAKGAPRAATGLRLADAIYRVHHGTGGREALREALDLLNETLGTEPDPAVVMANPKALMQRASILLQLHEFDDEAFEQAWRDCSLAAVTVPTGERAEIAKLMGQWLFTRHRYEEAVPYLRQALTADPSDGVLNGRIARALWMLDREGEALPYAGRSLELNPIDDRMWFVRGKCHQTLGQITEARLDLQTYLELHPDDELAVEALVEIGIDQGHLELAVERAQRFIDTYPEIEGASARFGRLLHLRGFHDRAVPMLRQAMEQNPDYRSAVVDLAVAISDLGDDHPGLVTALRSAEVDPDGDHLAYLRAECYLALSDPVRAEPDLADYVRRFPDAARALASLAGIWLDERRIAEAETLLSDARRAAPEDDYVREVAERAGFAPHERVRPGRRPSHVSRP